MNIELIKKVSPRARGATFLKVHTFDFNIAGQRTLGARQLSAHAINDYHPGSPRIHAKIMKRRQSVYQSSEGF